MKRTCEEHLEDLLFLAPWLRRGDGLEHLKTSLGKELADKSVRAPAKLAVKLDQLDQAPTLRELAAFEQTLGPLIEATLKGFDAEPGDPRKQEAGNRREGPPPVSAWGIG